MNLIGLTPYTETLGVSSKSKNAFSEINTGSPIFIIHENMDGTKQATYHVNLIYLLDRLFTDDYYSVLSIEQERFIRRFLYEAGKVMDKLDTDGDKAYDGMSDVMKQLDNFLGSYEGVNDGRFTK